MMASADPARDGTAGSFTNLSEQDTSAVCTDQFAGAAVAVLPGVSSGDSCAY